MMNDGPRWYWGEGFPDAAFVRRVLIVLVLVGLAYLAWRLSGVLILVFAAVLLATILTALAGALHHYARIPERVSLAAACLLIVGLILGIGFLFGTQMRGQLAVVTERLPEAVNEFGRMLGIVNLREQLEEALGGGTAGSLLGTVAGYGTTILGALADAILVIAAGIFIAANPSLYRAGVIKLFPMSEHARVGEALDLAGRSLKLWILGQTVSMILVGVLSTAAFWWIGLPAPIALGFIAGIFDFIPFIGPWLGAIPAVLIAFTLDTDTVLWTVAAILVIQQIEGNVIMPLVQRRVVSLPPAVGLFAIVTFGLLFGAVGLFLAVPLGVVTYVLVKKLYVRETLGAPTPVPGEDALREEHGSAAEDHSPEELARSRRQADDAAVPKTGR
jgi:predicted PurR-regulated permease PerM